MSWGQPPPSAQPVCLRKRKQKRASAVLGAKPSASSPPALLGDPAGLRKGDQEPGGAGLVTLGARRVPPGRGDDSPAPAPCWCHAAILSPRVSIVFPTPSAKFLLLLLSSFSSPDPLLCLYCIILAIFAFLGFPFVHHLPLRVFLLPSETSQPSLSCRAVSVRMPAGPGGCLSCPSTPVSCGQVAERCLLPAQS